MWEETAPNVVDDLRQGDLLAKMFLPRTRLPLSIARPPGVEPSENQHALIQLGRPRYFLVVSQCCTVENDKVAAIAPIKSTAVLHEDVYDAHFSSTPPQSDEQPGYVFAAHAIEPFLALHPPPVFGSRLLVADFLEIHTYSGNLTVFQEQRIARMTPVARRDLRSRLMAFWGRAEDGDKEALRKLGYDD
jgi:hypothetical protein